MTDARTTQVSLEEWALPKPLAEVTQVALEQWASVASAAATSALVTQVALEEWASTGSVIPPSSSHAFVMIMA